MRTITIPLTVLLALLVAASSAEAQSTRATVTVDIAEDSIEVAPSEGGGATTGNATGNASGNASASGGTSVVFEVSVQAGGFLCTSASSYEVTLAASGGPDGVTATVEPANLTFDLRMNVYPSPTSYSETQNAALLLSAGPTAPNGTGEVVVTATLSQGGCTPSTTAATADDSVNVTVGAGGANFTGGLNGTVDTNMTGNVTGGDLNETGENVSAKDDGKKGGGIPGFESAFVTIAVALAVALVAARRRKK